MHRLYTIPRSRPLRFPHPQRGLTLVELMIAMTLALAIVAAVTYVYIQGKTGYRVQDARSRLQENARLAYSLISRDLVMAGHFGCVKLQADFNQTPPISSLRITASQPVITSDIGWLELDKDQASGTRMLDPGVVVRGYDDGAGWSVPASIASKRTTGTDSLVVIRGGDDARHLTEPATATSFKIASALPGLASSTGSPLMVISNCTRGEVIKVSVKSDGKLFETDLVNDNEVAKENIHELRYYDGYDTKAIVTTFEPYSYYIAPAKGKDGALVPSLHRLSINQDSPTLSVVGSWNTTGQVLIEGVEAMTVRYFIQGTDEGTSLGPFTASEVTGKDAWRNVMAVRVDLTFVTDDDSVATSSSTQTVGGTTVTDRKLRLNTSFTTTVRNARA